MRRILRDATVGSHTMLDAAFGSLDLGERADYVRFLAAHCIGLSALDPIFADFVTTSLQIDPPDLLGMVRADLTASDVDVARLPQVSAPAGLEPAAVGYVVCGSRLGLAGIARQPYWGSIHGRPSAYMEDRSGLAVWRALLAWMEQAPVEPDCVAALTQSANAVFATFRQAFDASAAELRR